MEQNIFENVCKAEAKLCLTFNVSIKGQIDVSAIHSIQVIYIRVAAWGNL